MVDYFTRREAEASVALDGETQSEAMPNVVIVRRLHDGSLTEERAYHPDFPGVPHHRERGQHVRCIANATSPTTPTTE
jgi:hypothetical protein